MKEIIIILSIIAIVITGNIMQHNYLTSNSGNLVSDLEEIKTEFKAGKDFDKSREKINKVILKWDSEKSIWAIITDHNHMDKIELGITGIQAMIEAKQETELFSEIDKTIYSLKDTNEKNALKLKNIF